MNVGDFVDRHDSFDEDERACQGAVRVIDSDADLRVLRCDGCWFETTVRVRKRESVAERSDW